MTARNRAGEWFILLLLASTAPLLTGYHIGFDDEAIWLPAIKKSLAPGLCPLDSSFFLSQTQFSLFPQLVAFSISSSHLPLDLVIFLLHILTIFLVLLGARRLAEMCFPSPAVQWAAVATVWAARLTPVGGTHLSLMDMYLHPRDLALGAILFALVAALHHRPRALVWIVCAAVVHPTMALFGCFHIAFLTWKRPRKVWHIVLLSCLTVLAAAFLLFTVKPINDPIWQEVMRSRAYPFPLEWSWYAWAYTVIGLATLGYFSRIARKKNLLVAEHISFRVMFAGTVGFLGSILVTTLPAFNSLTRMETARTLHLAFFMMVFICGGLLGELALRDKVARWLLFLLPLAAGFLVFDRMAYPASSYVEFPGRVPRNAWVAAFDWVRRNTPRDALFALNPDYMTHAGEDRHGFRAFAERSVLADSTKDRSVASLSPELAFQWKLEERALESWPLFDLEDFLQLNRKFRVQWIVLEREHKKAAMALQAFSCPYANETVMVCRLP